MNQKQLDSNKLSKLSVTELEELLKRQQRILNSPSLISTLPDKGEKITKLRDKIQEALEHATLERLESLNIAQSQNQSSKSNPPFGQVAQFSANSDIPINVQSLLETLSLGQDCVDSTVVKTRETDTDNLLVPFAKKLVLQVDSTLDKPSHHIKFNEPLKKTPVSSGHSKSDSHNSHNQHWEGILQPSHSVPAKQLSVEESIEVSKEKVLAKLQKQKLDNRNQPRTSKTKSVKFASTTSVVGLGISNSCAQENTIVPTAIQAPITTPNLALKYLSKIVGDCESDEEDLSDDEISDDLESEDGEEKEHTGQG